MSFHISTKIQTFFHGLSGTVSALPHFCVFGGYGGAGVSDWCCVKMRKGAPWLNLTLLCDLCGISASGKLGKNETLGIGWIKGPGKPKKKSSRRDQDKHGHMEQGGPDGTTEFQCLSSSAEALISVFLCLQPSWCLDLYLLLNQSEMQIVPLLLCFRFFPKLAFLWSAIVPCLGLKSCCCLQTSHPSFSSYWVFHAEWPFPPCQSSLGSKSRTTSHWNKEVQR